MKQATAFITLAIIAAMLIGIYFFSMTDDAEVKGASVPEETINEATKQVSAADEAAVTEHHSVDPQLDPETSDFVYLEGGVEGEWDRVWVRPLNPIDTTCSVDWDTVGDELPEQTENCTDATLYERHPYYGYADDALENLAYGEALAAAILSERLYKSDPEKAYQLGVRAAAISGKPGPLMRVAYDLFPVGYEQIVWKDGQIDVSKIETHYVLASVAQRMGYREANPLKLAATYELDAERLESRVIVLLEELAATQESVSGSTQLKEKFDV